MIKPLNSSIYVNVIPKPVKAKMLEYNTKNSSIIHFLPVKLNLQIGKQICAASFYHKKEKGQ